MKKAQVSAGGGRGAAGRGPPEVPAGGARSGAASATGCARASGRLSVIRRLRPPGVGREGKHGTRPSGEPPRCGAVPRRKIIIVIIITIKNYRRVLSSALAESGKVPSNGSGQLLCLWETREALGKIINQLLALRVGHADRV